MPLSLRSLAEDLAPTKEGGLLAEIESLLVDDEAEWWQAALGYQGDMRLGLDKE